MVPPFRFTVGRRVELALYALMASSPAAKTFAALTNQTIDDTDSAFWTFAGSWHAVTPSTPCIGCLDNPDPSQAHNSTWHDGGLRSGSFSFQGSAVYIYGIDVSNSANMSFSMDNPSRTSFHYYTGSDYVYNSLFFAASGLDSNAQHTVTWILEDSPVGGISGLFDYAIITVDQLEASETHISALVSTTASESHSASPAPVVTDSAGITVSPASDSIRPTPATNSGSGTVTNAAGSTSIEGVSTSIEGVSTSIGGVSGQSSSSSAASAPSIIGPAVVASKSKIGPIIGAVVGGVSGLALLGAFFIFLRRRHTSRTSTSSSTNTENHNPLFPPRAISTTYLVEPYQVSESYLSMSPVSSNLKSPPGPATVLASNAQRPDPGHSRDLEVEERLRQLEALVAQPPDYS
ncbi:hypothetical protein C8R44DRAFT_802784 [Mycena epipterygia]|nr:hypothetical protein C8R44DRAFT_802784 [Mycena epipterygia]